MLRLLPAAALSVPCAALLLVGTAAAQGPLTFHETLDAATNHPGLLAAQQQRQIADAELHAARGGFDPIVRGTGALDRFAEYENQRVDLVVEQPIPVLGMGVFAGWRLSRGRFAAYDWKLDTGTGGALRAGLTLPLWRNMMIDRRRADIARAQIGVPVASAVVLRDTLDIFRLAATRYWEWVAAGRRLAINQDLLQIARVRDEQLAARVTAGDLPAIDRDDNVRAIAQREGQVVASQRALEQAAIELSLYLRGPDGQPHLPTPDLLPDSLPEPPDALGPVPSVEEARLRRPEAQLLEARGRQVAIDQELAQNLASPSLDLSLAGVRQLGEQRGVEKNRLEAMLTLELPTLNRAARGRLRAAQASFAQLSLQARFANDRIEADLRDAVSAVTAARGRIEAARREVEIARGLEEAERFRLDAGDGTMFLVNLREQQHAEARAREVDALADYQRAAALLRIAGGLHPATGQPVFAAGAGEPPRRTP
jgi:outer membrane protein TolC